jgi:predicted dehydrogenase
MGTNHARVLSDLEGARLVAVADSDPSRVREAQAAFSRRGYADYRTLLAEEELDAVTVAVPARLHAEAALACLERGLPVLVEKPIAGDVADAERIRDAAASARVPLMVGHVERFNPAVRELKRRLDSGEAGAIVQASARRVGPFFRRERDIGVAHDLATHDIDVLHVLLDCAVEQVQAQARKGVRTEHEDAISALLRFENGASAVIEANWLSPVKVRELYVLCEGGLFVLDYIAQTVQLYTGEDDEGVARRPPALASFPQPGEAPLRAELEAFLRVARGARGSSPFRERSAPAAGAEEAIAALRVAEAMVQSARRGEPVSLASVGGAI